MSATLVTPKTTSGGEIIRELVNASDGAGLHLQSTGNIEIANGAAQFGTSDFSLEFILNQEKENTSESYIYVTHTSGHNRLLIFHDVSDDNLVLDFRNASSASTKKDLAYDMNQDFGSPTHYVITFDRDGLATLYKNGNSVATVDISSTSAIDIGTDSSGSRIGTSSTDGVIGTFYRFRTWNKLLSSAEVQTAYERADVDYADQYGSQTDLTTNGSFASDSDWTKETGWTIAGGKAVGTNVPNNQSIYQSVSLSAGKRYQIVFEISGYSKGAVKLHDIVGHTSPEYNANGTYTFEFVANAGSNSVNFRAVSTAPATTTLNIEYVTCRKVGAVSDYDLAFANPTQSLMVQDRSGAADGTAHTSGVTQVQPIIQGNLTSLRVGAGQAATPADNQVLVDGGTTTAPSYAFAHTTNTGMWSRGGGKLDFATAGVTRIAINATGHVTMTSSDADAQLTLTGTGTNAPAKLNFVPQGTGNARIQVGGSDKITIASTGDATFEGTVVVPRLGVVSSNASYELYNNANTYLNGTSTLNGLATFNNGIALQTAASNDSATANEAYTLDKYETGTFTLADASGAGLSLMGGGGKYTRIGDRVFISVEFTMPTITNGSHMKVDGLPFPVADDDDARGLVLNYSSKANVQFALTLKDTDEIKFYTNVGAASTCTDGSAGGFHLNGHYKV